MRLSPICTRYDPAKREHYEISLCHNCSGIIDHRKGHYQDNFGRWEFCTQCYVHVPHPSGRTLAWWYAIEYSRELAL